MLAWTRDKTDSRGKVRTARLENPSNANGPCCRQARVLMDRHGTAKYRKMPRPTETKRRGCREMRGRRVSSGSQHRGFAYKHSLSSRTQKVNRSSCGGLLTRWSLFLGGVKCRSLELNHAVGWILPSLKSLPQFIASDPSPYKGFRSPHNHWSASAIQSINKNTNEITNASHHRRFLSPPCRVTLQMQQMLLDSHHFFKSSADTSPS